MRISRITGDYEYDPDRHAGEQRRKRQIPIEAIDRAIETGEIYKAGRKRIAFRAKYNGATFSVVVDPYTEDIITSYWGTAECHEKLETIQHTRKGPAHGGAAYRGAWR